MTRFEKEWNQNKRKWARSDAGTYRYLYRKKYNIPRISFDRTDELTDYDFEYEWLLEKAFDDIREEAINKRNINVSDGTFTRGYSLDEDDYKHVLDLAENDEYIDFEIPEDAKEGKRYSVAMNDDAGEEDRVPVDLEKIFEE